MDMEGREGRKEGRREGREERREGDLGPHLSFTLVGETEVKCFSSK
jgi:hypothetical protein